MKVAIITGVSRGIGKAATLALLDKGFKVYGLSRTKPVINNNNFIWIKCDLTKYEEIKQILNQIDEKNFDLLLSNAGVLHHTHASQINPEVFHNTFSVNTMAPMYVVNLLRKKLRQAMIISISSVSDRMADSKYSLYSASKAAITRYFESLAYDLPDASVYSLLPSYVDTPMVREAHTEPDFDWSEPMRAEQIADLIIKLVDKELEIESGSNIIVVNNKLTEDLKPIEKLYGFNVDNGSLTKIT